MDISIKKTRQFFCLAGQLFLLSCCFLHLNTQADAPFSAPTLAKGEGLLILDLDIKAPSAVMSLHKIGRASSPFEIKLVSDNGRWLIKALPKGDYQIAEIKVPYFDLPFRKDTGKNPAWRISIQAGHLNYAGRIEVEKERTEDYVAIYKHNRMVTDLPNLQKDMTSLLTTYPLVNGSGMRDDFIANFVEAETTHD